MEIDLNELKVMVIDDSNTIRKTVESLLTKVGCGVVTALDGFDALSKVTETKPNIIFIDVMMPRLDGYETCSIIRSNAEFEDTPIVLLSSKSSFCDKARGVVVGADGYLTKPFSKDELINVIEKYTDTPTMSAAVSH